MSKLSILNDSFEALVELGAQTAQQTKKAGKSVAKKVVNETTANKVFRENHTSVPGTEAQNHTELSDEQMKRLNDAYRQQDQEKMGEVRAKLMRHFRDYKREEEQFLARKKQEEEQKKQAEAQEEAEKKRKDDEQKQKSQTVAPKGKIRRNILQRAVKSSQPETRVGGGKQ